MCGNDEELVWGGSGWRHTAVEVEKCSTFINLDRIWRFIWAQVSDFCKKKALFLLSCRSPRGEGVDLTFLHADLIKPSAERKTGLDSWPCSTLGSIGASERTWWSEQHAEGNWTQLPRRCLFQGFSPLFLPLLFFSSAVSFLSGWWGESKELSPTDTILKPLVRVWRIQRNSHRLIRQCHLCLPTRGALCRFSVERQP